MRARPFKFIDGHAIFPLIALLAGMGVVIWQWSSARPLWLDEEMIALNFRDRTFAELTGRLWLDQTAPLGWLYIQRLATLTFGDSELVVRFVPAFFGIATLVSAAWIGYVWMTPVGATVLVLLCSLGEWLSFYSVELKQYSADAFCGLFLPALTVWAFDTAEDKRNNALLLWGLAIIISHWVSLAAVFVLPACSVLVLQYVPRHRDRLTRIGLIYLLLVVSVAIHYVLSIRYARESESLQSFWVFAFPPISAGVLERLSWLARQLQPYAVKPGGTSHWILFWLTAIAGFVVARPRRLGQVSSLVVLTGFVLAGLRIVPLYERVSLWFLPAMFVGIALFVDSAITVARAQWSVRSMYVPVAMIAAALSILLCADVIWRGIDSLRVVTRAGTNRSTDDRSSVSWILSQRRQGDAVITNKFSLPAIWWYGRIPLTAGGNRFPDGSPLLVADYEGDERKCQAEREAAEPWRRAVVYFGFKDFPDGFDDLVLRQLTERGPTLEVRRFADLSRTAIVDFTFPPRSEYRGWEDTPIHLKGCGRFREASSW